eukprot:2134074-Rhodomonas_salina.1
MELNSMFRHDKGTLSSPTHAAARAVHTGMALCNVRGTNIGHGAMRCVVLTSGMVLAAHDKVHWNHDYEQPSTMTDVQPGTYESTPKGDTTSVDLYQECGYAVTYEGYAVMYGGYAVIYEGYAVIYEGYAVIYGCSAATYGCSVALYGRGAATYGRSAAANGAAASIYARAACMHLWRHCLLRACRRSRNAC